jgi:hypothetical protein
MNSEWYFTTDSADDCGSIKCQIFYWKTLNHSEGFARNSGRIGNAEGAENAEER